MNRAWTQGSLEYTTSSTDLAIIGAGLFVVEDQEGTQFYTRAGSFVFDKDGCLVNQDGYKVQGLAINRWNRFRITHRYRYLIFKL